MKNMPQSRQQNIVVQELKGELLIYDLSLNKAFCLNQSSAVVWQLCDGEKSIPEIAKIVGGKLKSEINDDFIWLALDRLKKENLIANPEEISSNFNGLSRRQVIKRIGFSSMVALPLITSLVAPSAVHAQSGTCGGTCQCSGLLMNVSVCPSDSGATADCPVGCNGFCVIPEGGCVQGEGTIFCNGTCSNSSTPGSTCPVSTPGDCSCFGSFSINQTCAGVQCPGGCSACRVTQACVPQEVGPPACNGVCQQ